MKKDWQKEAKRGRRQREPYIGDRSLQRVYRLVSREISTRRCCYLRLRRMERPESEREGERNPETIPIAAARCDFMTSAKHRRKPNGTARLCEHREDNQEQPRYTTRRVTLFPFEMTLATLAEKNENYFKELTVFHPSIVTGLIINKQIEIRYDICS